MNCSVFTQRVRDPHCKKCMSAKILNNQDFKCGEEVNRRDT